MCRHVCYLGAPANMGELLLDPQGSLLEQTWAPRDMRGGGTINVDGFGVGWYPAGADSPIRYRSAAPMWTDSSFSDLARKTEAGAVLAAVRSATVGMALSSDACQPLTDGRWLFSHNGSVVGWPHSVAGPAKRLDVVELMTLEGPTDSALIWALLRQRMMDAEPELAIQQVLAEVVAAAPESRMNLLLTDGDALVATTWTHSLSVWRGEGTVIVSSEPFGDRSGWQEVPDRSLVTADRNRVSVTALDLGH